MGCETSMFAPGIFMSSAFILPPNSSVVSLVFHSLLSFKVIIKSALSLGLGSVGISPLPILLTTLMTSGNFSLIIFSYAVVVFIICESEEPVIIVELMAKSPSSNFGINSPPKEL